MRTIVIYGSGGHAKVVADILLERGDVQLLGFLDDRPDVRGPVLDLPILGGAAWLDDQAASGTAVALGIGDNSGRRRVAERCVHAGFELWTAVHPSAVVARSATLGAGTTVMANAVVNPDAHVGIGAIVNTGAIVEHDCQVGDYAHLSPNASMGGAARLGSGAHLGLGAIVLPLVSGGAASVVGAGAVVIEDLGDGVVAVGVPARMIRRVTETP